jgi:hypothetical protein
MTCVPGLGILCGNAMASRALSSHEKQRWGTNREATTMPLLFWMPMILMCGLWDIAEENTRAMMQAGAKPE